MGNEYIVELTGIEKSFSGVPILKKVDLKLKEGEVLALMGENGAGKSTLVNVLMGVHPKNGGSIKLFGNEMKHYDINVARENGVTIIPQELSLVATLSVAENVLLGQRMVRKNKIVSWKDMYREVQELIDSLGFHIDAKKRVDQLPISYRQVISILKALADNAKVIIMDEPTSSLSREEVVRLQNIITQLKQRGVSIIYISHLLDEVFEISDTITVLRDGEMVGSRTCADTTQREIVSLMVGEELFQEQEKLHQTVTAGSARSRENSDVLMRVSGWKHMQSREEIGFELKKGEVLGVTGLVGAGKTELLRSIVGLDKHVSGDIEIDGEKADIHDMISAYSNGISIVPEDRKIQGLVLARSARENIAMALPYRKKISKAGVIDNALEQKDAQEYVRMLSIKLANIEQPVRGLSGGNQQKCVIAKALTTNPKILMLDEPTRGIDVGARTTIYKLIRELSEKGMGIVLFTSDVSEVPIVCDRVLILSDHTIVGELNSSEVTVSSILSYAAGGKS